MSLKNTAFDKDLPLSKSTLDIDTSLEKSTLDAEFHPYVTSNIFSPSVLGTIRLVFGVWSLFSFVSVLTDKCDNGSYLSDPYSFAHLGVCAYFLASGAQTRLYAKTGTYPLQQWGLALRYTHILLTSIVTTFPIIMLFVPAGQASTCTSFVVVFIVLFDIVFAMFEIIMTNVAPPPWVDLPVTIILGIAHIMYLRGINEVVPGQFVPFVVGQAVLFVVVRYAIVLRTWIVVKWNNERGEIRLMTESDRLLHEALRDSGIL